MPSKRTADPPLLQRAHDRIKLLAAVAMAFFSTVYVAWGVIDVLAVVRAGGLPFDHSVPRSDGRSCL